MYMCVFEEEEKNSAFFSFLKNVHNSGSCMPFRPNPTPAHGNTDSIKNTIKKEKKKKNNKRSVFPTHSAGCNLRPVLFQVAL